MKKAIPYLILAVFFVVALFVKQYRERNSLPTSPNTTQNQREENSGGSGNNLARFRDPEEDYFFTKHARCRMECRRITQKEVKEIVRKADVNYNKSNMNDPKGPTYALEGYTSTDRQHVRVIVAPKQKHLSIVTVIDLDNEWSCPRCE